MGHGKVGVLQQGERGSGKGCRGGGLRKRLQARWNMRGVLVGAAGRVLEGQVAVAQAELAALEAVKAQLARFQVGVFLRERGVGKGGGPGRGAREGGGG